MTSARLLMLVRELSPNPFLDSTIMMWISEIEYTLATDISEVDPSRLVELTEPTQEPMLIPHPFDRVYLPYVQAMVANAQGETDLYENYIAKFNAYRDEWAAWVLNGRTRSNAYYIDAYQLAREHGYEGTIEQWLESLKGEKGDKGDGVLIKGHYDTLEQLRQAHPVGYLGDYYEVGLSPDDAVVYYWDPVAHEWHGIDIVDGQRKAREAAQAAAQSASQARKGEWNAMAHSQDAAGSASDAAGSASDAAGSASAAQAHSQDAAGSASAAQEAAGRAETAAAAAEAAAERMNDLERRVESISENVDRIDLVVENIVDGIGEDRRRINLLELEMASIRQDVHDARLNISRIGGMVENLTVAADGNLYTITVDSTAAYVKTVPANALPVANVDAIGGLTKLVDGQLVNADVTRITSAGIESKRIPDALRQLEGWGVGFNASLYNVLRGTKFVRKFVVVVLDGSNVTSRSTSGGVSFVNLSLPYPPLVNTAHAIDNYGDRMPGGSAGTSGSVRFLSGVARRFDNAYTSVDEAKRLLNANPLILMYELAEEQEVDCSNIISADFSKLHVAAGGSIVFEQANDTWQDIHSEVTYAIKIGG